MGGPVAWKSAGMIAARVAPALLAGVIVLAPAASVASAYTVAGASFLPDHGAPGAAIVVEGLPLAVDCPVVDVWLAPGTAPSPAIASSSDPRLIKLAGSVRVRSIGAGGANDTRPGTTFEFRVPAIQAGTYATYAQCRGGDPAFRGFGPGATSFTVEAGSPRTETTAGVADAPGPWPVLPAVAGVFGVAGLVLWWSRRQRRT